MLIVELYPWHSAHVTAATHPQTDVLNHFVWEPLAERAVTSASTGHGGMPPTSSVWNSLPLSVPADGLLLHRSVPRRTCLRDAKLAHPHGRMARWKRGPPRASEVQSLRRAISTLFGQRRTTPSRWVRRCAVAPCTHMNSYLAVRRTSAFTGHAEWRMFSGQLGRQWHVDR